MTDPISESRISQTDYLKLFMQELTYQDPLQPIDNKEFMAQMAQFSSLQEARSTNEYFLQLLGMTSGNQSLGLLGKTVKIQGSEQEGKVTKVEFYEGAPPKISIALNNGEVSKVELGQILQVRE